MQGSSCAELKSFIFNEEFWIALVSVINNKFLVSEFTNPSNDGIIKNFWFVSSFWRPPDAIVGLVGVEWCAEHNSTEKHAEFLILIDGGVLI